MFGIGCVSALCNNPFPLLSTLMLKQSWAKVQMQTNAGNLSGVRNADPSQRARGSGLPSYLVSGTRRVDYWTA